jgi:hypothetical protein
MNLNLLGGSASNAILDEKNDAEHYQSVLMQPVDANVFLF